MPFYGRGVEYALHCLLWLVGRPEGVRPSSRDLAELQGVPPAFLAKLFTKLEKAGIVAATEGVRGGYRLARPPSEITVLDVAEAVEGHQPLFDCREVRRGCALFAGEAPRWSTRGVCEIHAVMLQAEQRMRDALRAHTLASLAAQVEHRVPTSFRASVGAWLSARAAQRQGAD